MEVPLTWCCNVSRHSTGPRDGDRGCLVALGGAERSLVIGLISVRPGQSAQGWPVHMHDVRNKTTEDNLVSLLHYGWTVWSNDRVGVDGWLELGVRCMFA